MDERAPRSGKRKESNEEGVSPRRSVHGSTRRQDPRVLPVVRVLHHLSRAVRDVAARPRLAHRRAVELLVQPPRHLFVRLFSRFAAAASVPRPSPPPLLPARAAAAEEVDVFGFGLGRGAFGFGDLFAASRSRCSSRASLAGSGWKTSSVNFRFDAAMPVAATAAAASDGENGERGAVTFSVTAVTSHSGCSSFGPKIFVFRLGN